MTWKLTEQDFLNIIDRQSCLGKEVRGGTEKEGHENCKVCSGNYFVGGECNFGAKHTLANDLMIINRNFEKFELLVSKQRKITQAVSEKDFNKIKKGLIDDFEQLVRKCEGNTLEHFLGTCIGIENKQEAFLERVKTSLRLLANDLKHYIKKVQELDWWKLKNYQEKMEQIGEIQGEMTQTLADYQEAKERGDDIEANRLMSLWHQKEQEMLSLQAELEKDSISELFGKEANEVFENLVKNIFSQKPRFFNWKQEPKKKEEPAKLFGFIPPQHVNKAKWGIAMLIVLALFLLAWRFIKKIF